MPHSELGTILSLYEFEDRAGAFMLEVVELSKKHPNLMVDASNKSFEDLEKNLDAIQKSAKKKKRVMYEKAFARGREFDELSANEIVIEISVWGFNWDSVEKFGKLVDKLAENYSGCKAEVRADSKRGALDDEYKYWAFTDYKFRG